VLQRFRNPLERMSLASKELHLDSYPLEPPISCGVIKLDGFDWPIGPDFDLINWRHKSSRMVLPPP
jgi:hypothetical protein